MYHLKTRSFHFLILQLFFIQFIFSNDFIHYYFYLNLAWESNWFAWLDQLKLCYHFRIHLFLFSFIFSNFFFFCQISSKDSMQLHVNISFLCYNSVSNSRNCNSKNILPYFLLDFLFYLPLFFISCASFYRSRPLYFNFVFLKFFLSFL